MSSLRRRWIHVSITLRVPVSHSARRWPLVGGATAAPKEGQKNVEVIPINCEGLGDTEVITNENAASAFLPDGQVAVAKRFSGEVEFTVTTFDDEVFGPFTDSITEGAKGKGFEDRLIECTFTEEFSDTFTLDAGAAEFFGIPESYIGTEVTNEGTFFGTAHVFIPGD